MVVFSVTSTLDGEREGESGGWGRVSELGCASERQSPTPTFAEMQTLVDSEGKMMKG